MSRLRRLFVSGKIFFITCNLAPTRLPLVDADFTCLADAIRGVRTRRNFLFTGYVFMPDHWHALIAPAQNDIAMRYVTSTSLISVFVIPCSPRPLRRRNSAAGSPAAKRPQRARAACRGSRGRDARYGLRYILVAYIQPGRDSSVIVLFAMPTVTGTRTGTAGSTMPPAAVLEASSAAESCRRFQNIFRRVPGYNRRVRHDDHILVRLRHNIRRHAHARLHFIGAHRVAGWSNFTFTL